jgi:hypothetical protein
LAIDEQRLFGFEVMKEVAFTFVLVAAYLFSLSSQVLLTISMSRVVFWGWGSLLQLVFGLLSQKFPLIER